MIDIHTSLWQELVILSGLLAGLITFLLTTLFIDKVLQAAQAKRQGPVRRLALTELLHSVADEEHSQISRGLVVVRQLPSITANDPDAILADLQELLDLADAERASLTKVLGTWATFFTSTDHNEEVISRVAKLALELERLREGVLSAEASLTTGGEVAVVLAEVQELVAKGNEHLKGMVDFLEGELRG